MLDVITDEQLLKDIEDILQGNAEFKHIEIREYLKNKKLTEEQYNLLAKHENKEVRKGLTIFHFYHGLPESTYAILAKDKNDDIRYSLISNNDVPENLIPELLNDPYWKVKDKLIRNNKLSSSQLDKLANDKHWQVRRSVAMSSNLSKKTLKKLAKDKNIEVKIQIAGYPQLPLDIINILVEDGKERVLDVLTDNQDYFPDNVILDIFKCNSYWANTNLVANNKFSEKVLLWLFYNSEVIDMSIREWDRLIKNHKIPKYLHISFLCLEQCKSALGFTKRKLMHNVSISDLEKIYDLLRKNLKNLNYETVDVIFSEMRDKPISKKALKLIKLFKTIILKSI